MNDFSLVAQAINVSESNLSDKNAADDLSEKLSLSCKSLEKVFDRWSGISLDRFFQSLSEGKQRFLLKNKQLKALSKKTKNNRAESKLYKHTIDFRSISAQDYKSSPEDLPITYGISESPYGDVLIAFSEKVIYEISYCDAETEEKIIRRIKAQWHHSKFERDDKKAHKKTVEIFGRKSDAGVLKLYVQGTPFQLDVWRALLNIPLGSLTSYGDIAESIGRPQAVRAVGSAVGKNPISMLIPCHRVIRSSGALGGYRGGLTRKKAILLQELN